MSTRTTAFVIEQAITSVIPRSVPSKSCPVNCTYCHVWMGATPNEPEIKKLNWQINKAVYLNRTRHVLLWTRRLEIDTASVPHNWYYQSNARPHVSTELIIPSSGLLRKTKSKKMQWRVNIMLTWRHGDIVICWYADMVTCWHGDMLTCWHGDMLTCWHGDMVKCWHGDMLTCWHGDMVKWWHADVLTWWHADMVTCWHGDMLTWWHGDMLTCWHGDMVTWWYANMVTWWYPDVLTWWHVDMPLHFLAVCLT